MAFKAFLRSEMNRYLKTIGELSTTEERDLRTWVADGNHVYDNPFLICAEDGWPMDYINALRVNIEMYEDHINATNLFQFGQVDEDEGLGIPF